MASYVQLGQSGKVYRDPPPKKPPKKKKSNTQFAYILIALILVLGIGAMAGTMIWLTSGGTAPANSELSIDVRPSGTHTTAARPAVPDRSDGGAVPADSSSQTTPRTTSAPTVHYVKGTSGSFAGSDDYKVKLIAEYGLVKADDGSEKLNLRVYLQSFSLALGESRGTITANGKSIAFRTDKLTLDQNSRQKTLLTEQLLDVTQKEITVDISWHMGITYSGVSVDDLTVSGVITLP